MDLSLPVRRRFQAIHHTQGAHLIWINMLNPQCSRDLSWVCLITDTLCIKLFFPFAFCFKQEALQCFYIISSIVSTCALSVPGAYTGLSLEQSADFLSSPVQRYFNPALPELNRCNEVCQAAWQTHSWLAALVAVWWKCYTALSFSASARYSRNTALSGWLFCHHFGRERIRGDTHSHKYRHKQAQTGSIQSNFCIQCITIVNCWAKSLSRDITHHHYLFILFW